MHWEQQMRRQIAGLLLTAMSVASVILGFALAYLRLERAFIIPAETLWVWAVVLIVSTALCAIILLTAEYPRPAQAILLPVLAAILPGGIVYFFIISLSKFKLEF
jgi:hypothetical protein